MTEQYTIDTELGGILEAGVTAAEELIVVNPARRTLSELIGVLDETEPSVTVRVLAAEHPLKTVMDDFLIASVAADLIEDGTLAVRTLSEPPVNSLLVTEDRVVSVVSAGGQSVGLGTEDEAFVETVSDHYEDVWTNAEEFSLRTPPLSAVRSTLETELGAETLADFDAVLESLSAARGDDGGLDEVTISLLVAARNEQLLYDISKWGEDVGLASKATFSRTKTRLENNGLLNTEKVPIDVGRPRLRLLLGTDELRSANVEELSALAIEHLD